MPRKSPTEQWHDRLENASVPLRKLNKDGKPIGFASCCLGDYKRHRILLSSAHQVLSEKAKTSEPGDWAILSRHQAGRGDFYWFPAEVKYLCRIDLSNLQIGFVDFSYAVLTPEVKAYSQSFDSRTGKVTSEWPKTIHRLNFDAKPRHGTYYGFAGHTKHAEVDGPGAPIFSWEVVVADDLKYFDTKADMHFFKLGAKHPGHERFEGCSGAPIISKTGQVVALVCGGSIREGLIYGVGLSAYRTAVNLAVVDAGLGE